jgi:hypothetical protein
MTKSIVLLIGIYICIARTTDDPHLFTEPEQGIGHVAYGQGLYDIVREAVNECEVVHGYEQCELHCFYSRMEESL